jgi:hypothetical protein
MEKLILEHINTISKWVIGKNISHSIYSWTKDNSIFCKIGVNDYNIYLEIFLNENNEEIETIINVYKEKDCKLAYGGKIEDCLERITQLIKI